MSEKVVWQMLQQYATDAGVPGIAPHDCRRYAESRTMPNQNATTWLQVSEMGAERYRLLRMVRHSPVIAMLSENLNSGPPGRKPVFATMHTVSKTDRRPGLGNRPSMLFRIAKLLHQVLTSPIRRASRRGTMPHRATSNALRGGAATRSIRHSPVFGIAMAMPHAA
jgi:hypothetical protein